MPPISDVMVRSLHAGFLERLTKRVTVDDVTSSVSSASNTISDVKTAFSSWDNCMQANFCKWPVIAVIVVGGLILFSIVWCIIRCACCGVSCCCECCYCLKCCGNCCGCCDPPQGSRKDRSNGNKYLDDPYIPPNQGYTPPAPMSTGALGGAPRGKEPPQYAEFDVSKKGSGGDDALPEMPSWETSANQKVMVQEEGVELSAIKKSPTGGLGSNANASATNVPLMTGATATSGPASPISQRGQGFPGQQQGNGYGAGNGGGYGGQQNYGNGGYSGKASPYDQGQDQYGMGGAMGPGRRSPGQYGGYNNGYGQQDSYDQYGNSQADLGFQRSTSPQDYSQQGYGRQNSGGPMGGMSRQNTGGYPGPRRSPAPQQDPYGQQSPYGRQNSYGQQDSYSQQDSYGHQDPYGQQGGYGNGSGYGSQQQSYPPNPQRQYSSDTSQPMMPGRGYTTSPSPLGPPTTNNGSSGAFDFSSGGYSRPQNNGSPQMGHGGFDRQPSPNPPQQGIQRKDTYPGYKPFNPGY